jgi:Cu+-exporting ATPase
LRPTTARVRLDGVDRDLPINAILVGGVVVIRPGDRVPVDGEIPEGNSRDDESLLTGESLPVDKQPGDTLNGGAINAHGIRVARTTAVGLVMGGLGFIAGHAYHHDDQGHMRPGGRLQTHW